MRCGNEIQKCQYYCPYCHHRTTFENDESAKICWACGIKFNKPDNSVYDINQVKFFKMRYKLFLQKKEGI